MNYIRHLHAFYHHVKRDDRLSATHVSLYLALFQFWNYNRFQNPFRIYREELMQLSKIGSKNTYHKCMKELHAFRYIIHHTVITKYQPIKVSMISLDLKTEEKDFLQLDLFSTNDNIPPKLNSHTKVGDVEEAFSIKNDTHASTVFDTHTCPKNGTTPVPVLIAASTKNDTAQVPILGHYLKHKQINNKQVCVKNTPTQIFEKNKNLETAIAKLAGSNHTISKQKEPPPHVSNSVQMPEKGVQPCNKIMVSLPQVEIYFQENCFPIPEAKKFFYYNQGRGWMLTDIVPIKDWQALAQKWMLNNQNQKCIQNVKPGTQQNQHIDPGPGKDYSEPL